MLVRTNMLRRNLDLSGSNDCEMIITLRAASTINSVQVSPGSIFPPTLCWLVRVQQRAISCVLDATAEQMKRLMGRRARK